MEERWGKGEIEKRWGPLSRITAWRAGSLWEEMTGSVKVFLEKDGQRIEVDVEKWAGKAGPRFWFKEKKPQQPPQQEGGKDRSTPEQEVESETEEVDNGVEEVTPDQLQTERMMWLNEKATTLENENRELKRTLQEMEAKIALQENTLNGVVERCRMVETAITQIVEYTQRQDVFNESTKTSFNGLVDEVKKHQNGFREVVSILQVHAQHITMSETVSQQMAQFVDALIKDNERKNLWIGNLARETEAQNEVLQQHHARQQVLAEVIKRMASFQAQEQQPQQQGEARTRPSVEVADNGEDSLDFLGGQNPNSGPPNSGPFSATNQLIQVPATLERSCRVFECWKCWGRCEERQAKLRERISGVAGGDIEEIDECGSTR